MAKLKKWFVIVNPTSGSGYSKKKWPKIKQLLNANEFDFNYVFTTHQKHSITIVQQAINDGFDKIICVGGDGTLHNIVNGIMKQNKVDTSNIAVGVIPVGTGNDWIKTHQIPKNIEKAIKIIKNETTKLQDVGRIKLTGQNKNPVYFINLAGIGFDGYVVNRVKQFKRLGSLSYLVGALFGLISFKNFNSKISLNSKDISCKSLMTLIGLCKYSGGGMQLTKTPNPFNGFFDVTIAKNFSKFDILLNVAKLYNGKIINLKKVESHKSTLVKVYAKTVEHSYIQADGELIGKGEFEAELIPKAFRFYSK